MDAPLEHLLRLIPDQATEFAVMLLDTEGRIRYWNPGAERIFGIAPAGILGQPAARLFPREDVALGLPELEIAIARRDGIAENDRWMARPDDSRFWATGVMVALRDPSGELLGYAKILRNRTDLKEMLESFRRQAEVAEAVNRRKDIFLSTLSHELRNPLAPLSHAVEILRRGAHSGQDLEATLRIIERQVESLRRLVDDLMDITRIGTGKVELRRERVTLQELIRRGVESGRPSVTERRHDLQVLVPPHPIFVEADPSRIEQVIVNLIQNAAKYTPEGGKITISGTRDSREAVTTISDTGMGIPHDMLPRIFDLFTQVETSRTRSQGGLGIGLALVKDLVTMHGGSVQVRSDGPGKGSEFTVRLPLAEGTNSGA